MDEEQKGMAPGPAADRGAQQTIREMVNLETKDRKEVSPSDRIANWISAFAGSMVFAWLHVAWFVLWIGLNVSYRGWRFDAFPFGLLTMIVSLEAIFLSTFVLISQNRLSFLSDKRARIDLQVNLIAELEVTKVMKLVAEIHQHLGLDQNPDPEVEFMEEPTHIRDLVDAMDAADPQGKPRMG